ncbi:MAG: mannonate dehydratase [Ignavibacteria bacterium]|nr:mannonate dehydratase [Ignavibacteria bacterium]
MRSYPIGRYGRFLRNHVVPCILVPILILLGGCAPEQESQIPQLRKQESATQLIVQGKPFLMLGGELGNSTASSLEYLRPHWKTFRAAGINTILAPVYWELIEPREGEFDFSLVDSLITDARQHNIKLVLLWFGSWKNSMSCYVPSWMKRDFERFPRSQDKKGRSIEMVTAFSRNNLEADRKAFVEMMQHLQRIDGREHTVIMIQVENEIGMIPEARDYYSGATSAFQSAVPQELMAYLQEHKEHLQPEFKAMWDRGGFKSSGTWEEIFGKGLHTDEIFTAWYCARYVEEITAAGKKEYALPMFVNAALIREGYRPGQYPSGGPLPHLMDIWKAGAPSIDFLAPDIYHGSFVDWSSKFHRADNPLFIPEAGLSHRSAADAFYVFGQHDAMGFSPFAIESIDPEGHRLTRAYALLNQMTPVILEHQGKGVMAGVSVDQSRPVTRRQFGEYMFTASFEPLDRWAARPADTDPRGGAVIIQVGRDEFIVAGSGVIVTFESLNSERPLAGILSIDEGVYENGVWKPGRRLNGDQSHQGRHMRLAYGNFQIQRLILYQYK